MTERARRGAEHRDNRRQLVDDELHSHRPKKRNTKRWCRGVPGREHDYQKEYKFWSIQIPGCKKGYWHWKCSKCGREEYRTKDPRPPTVSDALRAKLDREGK